LVRNEGEFSVDRSTTEEIEDWKWVESKSVV